MKEIYAERWRQAQKRGMRVWVVQRGIIAWGLPMCGVFVGMQGFRNPQNFLHILLLNVLLWLAAGALFGVCTWYAMGWQYKRHLVKTKQHGENSAT